MSLSCGDDICSFCVTVNQTGKCHEGHPVDWAKVTTSRRLLKMVEAAQHSCLAHRGRPYDFWCSSCRVPLCGLCGVAHKDQCVRTAGGQSFYLMEIGNLIAADDIVRAAQEHAKAIEATTNDLEHSVPAELCKSQKDFDEFIANKVKEARAAFEKGLAKSVAEITERYQRERAAAAKEEEKRDTAIVKLTEYKGNIDMALMELNVAMVQAKDAMKADADAVRNMQSNANATPAEKGELEAHQKQQARVREKDIAQKAAALASEVAKLERESREGVLKGSVNVHHVRHLDEVKVLSVELLHPTWNMPDPPVKTCPLYRGVASKQTPQHSSSSNVAGGLGATSSYSYQGERDYYGSGGQVLRNDGVLGASSSSLYSSSVGRTGVVGATSSSSSGSNNITGPRESYNPRDVSPPSDRRPRLMESLWREQVRNERATATTTTTSSSSGLRGDDAAPYSTGGSSSRMVSPGERQREQQQREESQSRRDF